MPTANSASLEDSLPLAPATFDKSPTLPSRIVLAARAGRAIDYYDSALFGAAAALVFPTVFFSYLEPDDAIFASLTVLAAAVFARPLGTRLFDFTAERVGTGRTLTLSLLMGVTATAGVGLLPGATSVGIGAPLLLLALRVVRGVAVGAELQCTADRDSRGSFAPTAVGLSIALAGIGIVATNSGADRFSAALLDWGWRIPFLLSIIGVGVGVGVVLVTRIGDAGAQDLAETTKARLGHRRRLPQP